MLKILDLFRDWWQRDRGIQIGLIRESSGGSLLRNFALALVALSFSFGAGNCGISDSHVKQCAKQLEKIVVDGLKKTDIPGCMFVVARKGQIIHIGSYGKTTYDSNAPQPVTNSTVFPISSITKNITAILVGALVDAGILHWEDKVRKYLPNFFMTSEELSNEMTILDLVSHSSGYKHFSADSLFAGCYDKQKILDAFRHLKQKPGEFRKCYGYQNIVFGVIGDVIEAATGEKYEDVVQKYLFDKMGLTESSAICLSYEASKFGYFKYLLSRFDYDRKKLGFFKAAWRLITLPLIHDSKQIVIGHSRFRDSTLILPEIGIFHKFPATSGVSFSANDFAKWVQMLANGGTFNGQQIVSQETFAKITTPVVQIKHIKEDDVTFVKSRYDRDGLGYGIGTFIGKYSDNGKNPHNILFHMGGIYGACAFIAYSLDDDIAIGFVGNFGGVSHTMFAEYMVNQFLDLCYSFTKIDWVSEELNRKKFIRGKQKYFDDNMTQKNPTPMRRGNAYVGTYTSPIYGEIKITSKGNELTLSNGMHQTKLEHVNGDVFKFPCKNICPHFFDAEEYVSFQSDAKGIIFAMYVSCFSEGNTIFQKE
ncbi:MAG: serine hydrolase [Holosporales bacterium]|nr:serine hydrolase [Holosporales bacterium]